MNPLHVLLLTDDPRLAKGFSDALAEHSELADVEAVRPDAGLGSLAADPDLILVDGEGPAEEKGRYADSVVLRVRSEGEDGHDMQLHSHRREHGYVRREDLEEIAPVIVAVAGLARATSKRAVR